MIIAWVPGERGLVRQECQADCIPDSAIWIDLLDPTRDEEQYSEKKLGLELPTRAEMQEIEASSRLYRENGVAYMTATLLIKTETETPETTQVTFILGRGRMITIRYAEPWSFKTFAARAPKSGITTAEQAFATILDTTVERLADLLELVQLEIETLNQRIFKRRGVASESDLRKSLHRIATVGNILGKVRESLIDKNRIISFIRQGDGLGAEARESLRATEHDIVVLSDHATFNSGKINFLLDATLGLINIGVNDRMRTLSWVMVAVMWPTLVSGFFAMNVHLPFPGSNSEALWPFFLCAALAFLPLIGGYGWWWWRARRGR